MDLHRMALEGLDSFGGSALHNLRVLSLARRGRADGEARRPPASEAPVYAAAYQSGNLERRAMDGEIVLVFAIARVCPMCGNGYEPTPEATHCARGHERAELDPPGYIGLRGPVPDDDGEPNRYFERDELRALVLAGVDVLDQSGQCLNPEILIQ